MKEKMLMLSELELGMSLSRDVRNKNNLLVLPQGVVLEEKHLKLFVTWSVECVHIETDEEVVEITEELLNARYESLSNRMRFAHKKGEEAGEFSHHLINIALRYPSPEELLDV